MVKKTIGIKKRRNFGGHYYKLYIGKKTKATLKKEGFFVRDVSGRRYIRVKK
jgi:hypothetical protein